MSRPLFRRFVARAIATAGGAGYVPVAPGTFGTLVAVPLAWLLAPVGLLPYGAFVAAVVLVGIVAAREADESWSTHDSGRIVIDEVAGYLATMGLVPRDQPAWLFAGFVTFRLLDILKPPPARWIDRHLGGGAGVVLDDLVAGIYGAVLLWLGHRYLPL